MTVRYGIISSAQIVPRFVAGVRQSKEGEVAAIASRTLEKAQAMADQLKIPQAYGSYQELYEDESIDIVYIATYNRGHYQAAKDALSAGKNVLVEKPFTLTLKEAKELFSIAQKQQVFLMEAQKAVFLPATRFVKEKIKEGKIGSIHHISSTTSYPSVDYITWFYSIEAGGGALHGCGGYPLQYMQYVTDSKIDRAVGTALNDPGQADSQCDVSLVLKNQIQANIFITTNLDLPSEVSLYGEKGKIVVPYFWKADKVEICIDNQIEKFRFPYQSEFVYEVDHVNECLNKGLLESPMMTKEMTLQTVEVIEKLYRKWMN